MLIALISDAKKLLGFFKKKSEINLKLNKIDYMLKVTLKNIIEKADLTKNKI